MTNRALKRGCSPRGEHRTWSPEDQLSQCEAGNDNEASKKKRKRETLASSKYPDGEKFERESLTRDYEEKLAKAQRHRKKRQAKSIHAKIKNKRQDWNYKASRSLTKRYNTIYFVQRFVGQGAVSGNDTERTRYKLISRKLYSKNWLQPL